MASQSKIEWTEMTWNPTTGCTKISAGCKNCYAERMAKRLQAMGIERYKNAFQLTVHNELIDLPIKWKAPHFIFVNSMSDLFHEEIPIEFIQRIFDTMTRCPQHSFQVLTKRSQRLEELSHLLPWPSNIWIGVTIENSLAIPRIYDLLAVPAAVRFLSCEPLIGPLDHLPLTNIQWVIVGGESGPNARPMSPAWVDSIFNQCRSAGVPFFFKQWGGVRKKSRGRELYGQTYDEMPISILSGSVSQLELTLQ